MGLASQVYLIYLRRVIDVLALWRILTPKTPIPQTVGRAGGGGDKPEVPYAATISFSEMFKKQTESAALGGSGKSSDEVGELLSRFLSRLSAKKYDSKGQRQRLFTTTIHLQRQTVYFGQFQLEFVV